MFEPVINKKIEKKIKISRMFINLFFSVHLILQLALTIHLLQGSIITTFSVGGGEC
jgi:hypothetical protein